MANPNNTNVQTNNSNNKYLIQDENGNAYNPADTTTPVVTEQQVKANTNSGLSSSELYKTLGTVATNNSNTQTNKYATDNQVLKDVLAANNEKPEYNKPQDTSSGVEAALGTQYSWDKQGMDAAQNQYQQEVLKAKQDALANRQTIEQNALQYQQQADMMQYANNQNAEKVGWTGGYVLDQNRQMDYLKASIQAQMYGAMELQKYGYDTALAAARLSYDMNQKEFAHKYYQDAVNVAVTEAQLTGTYFSAETRDMMSQYNAADYELEDLKSKTLEEIDAGIKDGSINLTAEQERAYQVKKNITDWYYANNVSTTGIQTLAAWETEQALVQQWADKQWQMYQAALDSAEIKAEDANVFIRLDAEGNPVYNGTQVETLDFRTLSGEDLKNYISATNSEGTKQVYGYIDNTLEKIILNYIDSATTTTKADGTEVKKINKEELIKALTENDRIKELQDVLPGYSYQTKAGNSTVTITTNQYGYVFATISDSESTELIQKDNSLEPTQKDVDGSLITTWDTSGDGYNFIYSGTGDNYEIKYKDNKYNITVVWSNYQVIESANGLKEKDIKNANSDLKELYKNSSTGKIAYYNNNYWVYNGDTKAWGLIALGEDQDNKASQGEELIKSLINK